MVLITVVAWLATYLETRHMGPLMRMGVPMSIGMEGWADLASFAAFTAMWAIMMIAMMLPSSYPTLLLHRTIYSQRSANQLGGTLLFALGYFVVWSATGALFFAAYVLIGHWRSSVAGSETSILRVAGASFVLAGVFQWSRLKHTCLKHCQSPLHFVMEHWSDGRLGAARMGAKHGFYCFGCCWGLMLILFVMGVMHLGWMVVVAVFILLEKIAPSARWLPKLAGVMMVATGIVILISPDTLLKLSSQITIR